MPAPSKGLDWDDEDLTTRVFDRPLDEIAIAYEDGVLHELDFDSEHTSRITEQELEALKAQLTSEEEDAVSRLTSTSMDGPQPAGPLSSEVRNAADQTESRSRAKLGAFPFARRKWTVALCAALAGVLFMGAYSGLSRSSARSKAKAQVSKVVQHVPPKVPSKPALAPSATAVLPASAAAPTDLASVAPQPAQPAPTTTAQATVASPNEAAIVEPESKVRGIVAPQTRSRSSDQGLLRINARPRARVYVDGSLAGTTPQRQIAVSVGPHEVVLESEDAKLRKVLSINVTPGETETHIVDLEDAMNP